MMSWSMEITMMMLDRLWLLVEYSKVTPKVTAVFSRIQWGKRRKNFLLLTKSASEFLELVGSTEVMKDATFWS